MKAWPVRSSATPRDGHLRFGRVHRGQLVATELLLAPRIGGQDAVARSDRRPRGRRVAPPGVEPGLPNPERRPQGNENRQIDRKWRPDEHRRPVGLTSMPLRSGETLANHLQEVLLGSPDQQTQTQAFDEHWNGKHCDKTFATPGIKRSRRAQRTWNPRSVVLMPNLAKLRPRA